MVPERVGVFNPGRQSEEEKSGERQSEQEKYRGETRLAAASWELTAILRTEGCELPAAGYQPRAWNPLELETRVS